MTDVTRKLFSQLNMVVLQHISDWNFVLVSEVPAWFDEIWGPFTGQQLKLTGQSPFLEDFMVEANAHWQAKRTSAHSSGVFMEQPGARPPYPLEALAMCCESQSLLVIVNQGESFQEQQKILQIARENALTQEQLELEVVKRTREIRQRENEVAGRLIYAAGFRDEETGAHIRRIGLYSAEMAKALAWSPLLVDDIQIAAPMHDLGKIGIPDKILKKPGRLTPEEFEIMKDHPRIGAEILGGSDIPMIVMAGAIAGNHHERWDGRGYPAGLQGEAIPVAARIVAIVDVYDALVHQRVYKEAIPEEEAMRMMRKQSGSHFDPDLFALFEAHLDTMRDIRNQVTDD